MCGVIVIGSTGIGVEIIGAATHGASGVFDGVVWLAVIVFLVMLAVVILAYLRRRMRSSTPRDGQPDFDLAELRRLRDTGQVTTAEYENLTRSLYPEPK